MEIKVSENTQKKIINKIILILTGVFIETVIASTSIKLLDTWGVLITFLLSSGLVFVAFRYTKKGSPIRTIATGIAAVIIIALVLYFALLHFVTGNIGKVL